MRGFLLALCLLASPAAAQSIEVAINTPEGQLQGTLERAEGPQAALILPGSGPTDRDGNQLPLLHSDAYRLLAEDLAAQGITTLRIDKRGIGGSAGDPNAVSLDLYAQDTAGWMAALRVATGAECVWILGHSEGALIALRAAQLPGVCGLVLLTPPGRPLGDVLLDQLADDDHVAPFLPALRAAITAVENGTEPDLSTLPPMLANLFTGPARAYVAELMRTDPAAMIREIEQPVLVLHGDADIQTPPSEAAPLRAARPDLETLTLPGMMHMLKAVEPEAASAGYRDPTLPLHPGLIPAIMRFIETRG